MAFDIFSTKLPSPDILDCLASLSNDEVFTPPRIANAMLDLLPQEIFASTETTFLDPACKSGIFLREIAKRLLKNQVPDYETRTPAIEAVPAEKRSREARLYLEKLQAKIDHIFQKQLFALAITDLTANLARRSVYCSRKASGKFSVTKFSDGNGNIFYKNHEHKFVNGSCEFCGASESVFGAGTRVGLENHAYQFIHTNNPEEILNMKFDVIIGNPPYQLNDGGGSGSSAIPIYQYFVEQAKNLSPRFLVMIIPSRWFAGGKGLQKFRETMLNDIRVRKIVDFTDSTKCFTGVTIAGGVNYFLWERDYSGNTGCTIVNVNDDISTMIRKLNEYDIFVRDNVAIKIIRKVSAGTGKMFDSVVFPRNYFGLVSGTKGFENKFDNSVKMLSLDGFSYIEKTKITDDEKILSKYKVIMTKAMSGGNKPSSEGDYLVASTVKVLKPREVCSETYLVLGTFDSEECAENLRKYVKTKFFRFLLLQALTSINISREKYCFVPVQDFSKSWTDEELYKKYKLTKAEIEFIESMIRPMED